MKKALILLFCLLNAEFALNAKPYKADPVLSAKDMAEIKSAAPLKAAAKPLKQRKVLVFSRTCGFRHYNGIAGAKQALKNIAENTGICELHFSDDTSEFEPENLEKYDAVVINNSTGMFLGERGDVLNKLSENEKAKVIKNSDRLIGNLVKYVENGGGFLGIHASADSYNYEPFKNATFVKMMNGYFVSHPWSIQNAPVTIRIEDKNSPILKGIWRENSFKITDEIYQLSNDFNRNSCRVLLSLDIDKSPVTTKRGKTIKIREDKDVALVFIRKYGKGKLAYFGFGHDINNYKDKNISELLMRLTQFVCGDLEADTSPAIK